MSKRTETCIICGAEMPEIYAACTKCLAAEARKSWKRGAMPQECYEKLPADATEVPLEHWYQQAIAHAFGRALPGCMIYKQQQSIYASAGLPDLTVIYKGRHIAIECKRPHYGKVSDLQRETIYKLRDAGAIAYAVRSPIEARLLAEKILDELKGE